MDVWRARPNLSFEPRSSVRLRTSSLTALHSIGPKHKPLQESHNKLLGRSLRVAREVWLRLLGRVLTTSRRHLAKWPTVLPSCLSTLRPHASHASRRALSLVARRLRRLLFDASGAAGLPTSRDFWWVARRPRSWERREQVEGCDQGLPCEAQAFWSPPGVAPGSVKVPRTKEPSLRWFL